MKILKNNLFLCGLAISLIGLGGCGSSTSDADEPTEEESIANNSATGASISMDATGSGIQMALESLVDDESNLVKAVTRSVTGTEEQDCAGSGTLSTEYDVTEETESSGFGTATSTMEDCGGATGELTATFTYTGYSDDGTNITVGEAIAQLDGTLTVTVDDSEVNLTFDNDTAEVSLTAVFVGGSMTSGCVQGTATTTVDGSEGTCIWDDCVSISDVSALAEDCVPDADE